MKAFTLGIKKVPRSWDLKPFLTEGAQGNIIVLYGPISYYVESIRKWDRLDPHDLVCIDAGGRCFGVDESVYVTMESLDYAIRTCSHKNG